MGDYGSDAKGASARLLSQAWEHLRLAERAPLRFPSWDAILVTAASNAQAALYQQQLEAARYFGRIAEGTLVLAVPDPQGKRIGSGGATLSALRVLADQLSSQIDNPAPSHRKSVGQSQSSGGATPTGTETVGETGGVPVSGIVDPRIEGALEVLAGFRVLLVHGGGDSKRVPWANPIGKPFIPLPFLVARDSDEPVPTLFDHILAVAAPALGAMQGGGVLIMTGDVLPIFDSKFLFTPDDGACIVTTLASLDVASRHGVLVSEGGSRSPQNQGGGNDEKRAPTSANQSDLKRNRSSDSILDPQAPVSVKPLNLMSLPPIASIAKPTPIAAHPLFSSPPPSPHAAERSSSPKILSPRTVCPPLGLTRSRLPAHIDFPAGRPRPFRLFRRPPS
ncbi:hypothetical protein KFL_000420185 [Klebsormidium nitens]|uniref:GDP-fucose pyrophosphorylase domain-containing protein n=1 Tax=Klebsormidium nitens TaxID=105231 RepID=A0A1Y1HTT1_KLENI|nr:hypothetical protein KFL_000420185 [Klebsormidium nitens]|eukprot:GAQ79947.1 hypothetical protein KFL_000420185 [Klebsormidium nitens]